VLAYKVPGFTYPIGEMDPDDRDDFIRRLNNQLKAEAAAMKRGNKRRR
jgi:hypothetical protein